MSIQASENVLHLTGSEPWHPPLPFRETPPARCIERWVAWQNLHDWSSERGMLLVFGSAWVKQTPLCKNTWTLTLCSFLGKITNLVVKKPRYCLSVHFFFRRAESLNHHDTSGRFLSLAVASLIVVRITFHVVLQAFSASKLILMQVVAWDLLVKNLASITNESHLVFQAIGFF